MRVMHVVGARPNFMKAAPIMAAMSEHAERFQQVLVHTGQHYDQNMSEIFFRELGLPRPDASLNVGSGSHAEQTARVMLAFEPVVLEYRPDWVMVVGDVNSTLACALVCSKIGIPVAHVEAGLRSGDRQMPEEINRVLTDQISDALFTPSSECLSNLRAEGVDPRNVHFVGNVMVDTLVRLLPAALRRPTLSNLQLQPQQYLLATLHRPSNVDDPDALREILTALQTIAQDLCVIFPIHPRTQQRMRHLAGPTLSPSVRFIEPLGYLDFLALMNSARLVITDSGGVQEETTFLGVPCLTVRPNTERPITIQAGTNRLVGTTCSEILGAVQETMQKPAGSAARPKLWDGQAARRITEIMLTFESAKGMPV